MSSRTKRTTTTTVTQQAASSSQPGTPASSQSMSRSPGRVRPSSPTVITRKEEKKELAGLNDRLAAYIDRVRFLEGENKHLRTQVQTNEETVTREVTNIKQIYETELADARKLLDETAKEKAKLQIDAGKYKTEADEWKDRAKRSEAEAAQLDKRLRSAEAQVNDLQARLSDAVNDRKHWETEYNKLRKEVDSLTKQLDTARKQLEAETLSRVDLENRLQSLKEELTFKDNVHEQQLNETRTRTQVTIDEVDSQLQKEYEGKLKDALQDMREDYEYQIRSTREETEEVFEKQLTDIRDLMNRKDTDSEKIKTEIRSYRKRIDDLSTDATRLNSLNATLEARVKELEDDLRREQEDHKTAVDQRDHEIRRLREALEDQLSEYRDLLDIKIALDVEIAAYRKLLEGEEARLNISTASEATPRRGGTPRRTAMVGRKRKRGADSGYMQRVGQSDFHYVSNGHSTGPVEIYKTDEEGKFIKLFNNSDKDVAIGGWTLKHEAAGQETVYKFHRAVQLKAKQYVTVWSAESGQAHNPPSELVMKGQKWFVADQMKSTLVNTESEDTATMEMEKTLRSQSRSGFTDSGVEGDPQDKCSIM